MIPKNLSKLLILDLLAVFSAWLNPSNRALILSTPKLAPWIEDITKNHSTLLTYQPTRTALGVEGLRRDRISESAVRSLHLALLLGAELALAEGHEPDSAAVASWRDALSDLFPDGTRFLLYSWPQQVSATDRTLASASSPPTQALSPSFNAHGRSLSDVLSLVTNANNDLRVLTHDRIESTANSPSNEPSSEAIVRRKARTTIKNFLSALDQEFPPDHPSPSTRNTLLAPLLDRLKTVETPTPASETPPQPASPEPPKT
jgi:hypothetical protein